MHRCLCDKATDVVLLDPDFHLVYVQYEVTFSVRSTLLSAPALLLHTVACDLHVSKLSSFMSEAVFIFRYLTAPRDMSRGTKRRLDS